jgi:gas vesicle protein
MNRDDRLKNRGNRKRMRDMALLMTGIGIGSGIALLSAPSSGEELRHTIGRGYRKAARRIGRHTEDLRDRADELLDHAQDLRELGSRLLHLGRSNKAA